MATIVGLVGPGRGVAEGAESRTARVGASPHALFLRAGTDPPSPPVASHRPGESQASKGSMRSRASGGVVAGTRGAAPSPSCVASSNGTARVRSALLPTWRPRTGRCAPCGSGAERSSPATTPALAPAARASQRLPEAALTAPGEGPAAARVAPPWGPYSFCAVSRAASLRRGSAWKGSWAGEQWSPPPRLPAQEGGCPEDRTRRVRSGLKTG